MSGMNLFIKVVWGSMSDKEKLDVMKHDELSSMLNSVSISTKRVCNWPIQLSSIFANLDEKEQDIWNEKASDMKDNAEDEILPKWTLSKLPNDITLCEKQVSRDIILSYRWTYRRIFEKVNKVLSSGRKGISQAKTKLRVPEQIFKKTKCIVKVNCGYVVWNSLFQPGLEAFMVKKTSDVQYYQLKSLESIETFLSFHGRNASSVQLENNVKGIVSLKVVIKTVKRKIGYVIGSSDTEWIVKTSSNKVETYLRDDSSIQVFPFTAIYNRKLLNLTILFDRMTTRDGRLLLNQCS